MALVICSLIRDDPTPWQEIPADGGYHLVRFPFVDESDDPWGMHDPVQPDGYEIDVDGWDADDRSGLIWPSHAGWGWLTAKVEWEPAPAGTPYTEVRDQFVRDPLELAGAEDTTATEDWAVTPGGQYRHKSHEIFVHPDVPLGFRVRFGGGGGARMVMAAQFKLAVGTDVLRPPAD